MENNYYQVYTDSVYALASSLVVKSSDTATAINVGLQTKYGTAIVNPNDQTTWKYYLNLSGEYHPTDTVMQVVSVDTLQTIDFTKENLQFHRGTEAAYAYGTTSYLELVNKYPDQVQLIMGILYPADITSTIAAQDGTIVSYPGFLVEDHEYSLINRLQEWIYSYYVRWHNPQYGLSDDLYMPVFLGIMHINLVAAITTFRLRACMTNEVHSFHLRQYLASHGLLDVYLDFMTRSQALFLYRNIAYIERNSGQRETFDWLMQHILTEIGLPLAEFQMRHDLSGMPTALTPLLSFQKNPLNTAFNYDGINTYTLNQVFDKEAALAKDNVTYRDDEEFRAEEKMTASLSNNLKTKLLESSIIDYTGSEHYTLADTLFYEWLWLSHTDYYRAFVQIKSPVTDETISLSAKDAFVFYTYMACKTIGNTLTHVPAVIAKRVIRVPRPSVADIMSVTTPDVISTADAQTMLATLPVPQPMISVESFYDYCNKLQKAALQQYYSVCNTGDMDRFAQMFALMSRCWADAGVRLADPIDPTKTDGATWDTVSQTWDSWATWDGSDNYVQLYADWFASRNIPIASYSIEDLQIMQADLLSAATGVDAANVITLKQIQQAMIKLMAQLSSYSVQYVASINAGPLIDADTGFIRFGQLKETSGMQREINIPVGVLSGDAYGPKISVGQQFDLDLNFLGEITSEILMTSSMNLELTVGPEFSLEPSVMTNTMFTSLDITVPPVTLPPNPQGLIPVVGLDKFLLLTPEQQASVPDVWQRTTA
jgi:hypothetical protein